MSVRRPGKFIWITWLPKLMVRESQCEWALWFRSNYKNYKKVPPSIDLEEWKRKHARLVREFRNKLESKGVNVSTEMQNKFSLEESGIIISGQPDLVGVWGDSVTVYECKTGKPQSYDVTQALLYMYYIPRCKEAYKSSKPNGCIVYYDGSKIEIPNSKINEEFLKDLDYCFNIVLSNTPPVKRPSEQECESCDISSTDCPERVEPSQNKRRRGTSI